MDNYGRYISRNKWKKYVVTKKKKPTPEIRSKQFATEQNNKY